jgi:hypothetical protein
MPDIIKLCDLFYERGLTKNDSCLKYSPDSFTAMDAHCNDLVDCIKREIYPNHPKICDCLLDHHKIVAVHVLSVLKNQPFIKKCHFENETYVDTMPNEHYCLLLLQTILLVWHKSYGKTVRLTMPVKYKDCLLLLFRKYRMSRSSHTDDVAFAYALSNIVYLIDTYFVIYV